MKIIYYDIVNDFVNDLQKKLGKNIELHNNEKKIKIESEIIEYEEKDIGFRSFSVPYFVKNQTVIEYKGTDNTLINAITQVCTAYTDNEINAIEETMPILKKYSEERKENLKGVAIIWRDHFLEENVGLLTSFIRMGVEPKDILAIDKGDSTKHRQEITETFKKLGFQVDVLDNTAVANDILIEDGRKLVKDFIEKRGEYSPGKNIFSYAFVGRGINGVSVEDYLWRKQREIILELAEQGNCVIVGRCADYILRDRTDSLHVFIHADLDKRIERVVKLYGETDQNPQKRLADKDKTRRLNYKYYTDRIWGMSQNYDITLNSGKIGLERCGEMIVELAKVL